MSTRFRRRIGRVPLPLLPLLALALTMPVREASAQSPPPQPAPYPSTLPATEVCYTNATLNATALPGPGGYVFFEWGTNTAYGNETSPIQIGPGTDAVPFSAPLAGLTPSTIYHFRAVGESGMTLLYGDDWRFTTLPGLPPQFTFTTNNGTITITGYAGPVTVTIPSTITGFPVTSIGAEAFYQHNDLTSVVIPDSVTSIGNDAFNECTSLTSVTIPNSVTSIGDDAFYKCYSLTSVTIPDSVTSIGNQVFCDCTSLTSVAIGTNVTDIGVEAFFFCTNLTTVTIPDSVTSIGRYAFGDCFSLTSITIGTKVTSIGDDAFFWCYSLMGVYFQGNAPSLGGTEVFLYDGPTVYYLPGTTGWGSTFGGLPTAWWLPTTTSTMSATGVSNNSATLNGTVNPDGWPTTAWFQWGATTNYGKLTSATNLGSGTTALLLSAPVAGLTPGVTYHFRIAATNDYGLTYGSDQSFTTATVPPFSDDDWVSLGSGMNGGVCALAVSGTNLYAGGHYSVSQWNGSVWSDLRPGIDGLALAVSGTNLYAGGFQYVLKWNGHA